MPDFEPVLLRRILKQADPSLDAYRADGGYRALPKAHPGPIYLCVNADESEPCTFNNRILMEEDPHQVLEGIIIASYATRASVAYVYIRYEYGRAYRAMQAA